MKEDFIMQAIDKVFILPPAIKEKIQEVFDEPLTKEYMDSKFEKIGKFCGIWLYHGHCLEIGEKKRVTPTACCSVKFWVRTKKDLAEAMNFIDGV